MNTQFESSSGHSARFSDWAALDKRTQTVVAATAIDRAHRLEPRLNAFVSIEDNLATLPRRGPLADLSYAAKDLFITPSRLPTCGLASGIDFALNGHAEALRRLDLAGAFRIGFTAMTELAYEPSGHNSVRGRTRNPWNLDFVTGGSSSGSAAATASGTVVAALGSDTGGSLRIPAHCCGVTAWKPTFGIVSVSGALPLAPTLDVIGLLTRSADDMLPVFNVLAGDQLPTAWTSINRAVVLNDVLETAEPSVRRACGQGIDAVELCGVKVDRVKALSAIEAIDVHSLIVMQVEAARVHFSRLNDPTLDATLRKRLSKGLAIDDATLAASRAARSSLAAEFEDTILANADVALLPVMAIRTPPAVETDPASPAFRARTLYDLSRFTRFVNMLGFPAVAIPVGFDDRGLPVSMQIVGRPGSDRSLLALAAAVQAKTDWHARIPTGVADLVADMGGLTA
jgi:aspartyl-tRNA(Asn)/glutamyl-tRNA(Gln) amidotransferase subunit A